MIWMELTRAGESELDRRDVHVPKALHKGMRCMWMCKRKRDVCVVYFNQRLGVAQYKSFFLFVG